MENFNRHLLSDQSSIRDALVRIDELAQNGTIFIVDEDQELIGSLTDGDIRRALLAGAALTDNVSTCVHKSTHFIRKGEEALHKIKEFRAKLIYIVPVLEKDNDRIVNVLNLHKHRSYLPIDAIIMAGGQGQRLRPLTESTPKPLLKVGGVPIIERNIDRMALYGIDDISISVNYLGEQLEDYFKDGSHKGIKIHYVWENEPLGTVGSASLIDTFHNDYVMIMNSDLLTNIDFEALFLDFMTSDADLSIVSIPYEVDVPYAVLECTGSNISALKEKPRYTYYCNGGIYLMKREVLDFIPQAKFYNATDLVESLIAENRTVRNFPMVDYWLDIGNHHDFNKAQADVQHIRF